MLRSLRHRMASLAYMNDTIRPHVLPLLISRTAGNTVSVADLAYEVAQHIRLVPSIKSILRKLDQDDVLNYPTVADIALDLDRAADLSSDGQMRASERIIDSLEKRFGIVILTEDDFDDGRTIVEIAADMLFVKKVMARLR